MCIAVTTIVPRTIHGICSQRGRINDLSLAVPITRMLRVQAILNHFIIVTVQLARCQVRASCRWSWVLLVPVPTKTCCSRNCFQISVRSIVPVDDHWVSVAKGPRPGCNRHLFLWLKLRTVQRSTVLILDFYSSILLTVVITPWPRFFNELTSIVWLKLLLLLDVLQLLQMQSFLLKLLFLHLFNVFAWTVISYAEALVWVWKVRRWLYMLSLRTSYLILAELTLQRNLLWPIFLFTSLQFPFVL